MSLEKALRAIVHRSFALSADRNARAHIKETSAANPNGNAVAGTARGPPERAIAATVGQRAAELVKAADFFVDSSRDLCGWRVFSPS